MKEVFDTYIENTFDGTAQAAFKFKQFEFNYRGFFPRDKKARLLDIGVGRGEMLSCMGNWGYSNYLGVDISPSTVRLCKKLGLPCELVENTAGWLDRQSEKFALVTLLDVLEHFEKKDVIPFLKSLKASLAPGGIIIIQVPNLQARDAQLHHYNDITHEFGYTEHSLKQVVLISGLKVREFGGFEQFVFGGFKEKIKKALRSIYFRHIRFTRVITGNMNPAVLDPVFYAVVQP